MDQIKEKLTLDKLKKDFYQYFGNKDEFEIELYNRESEKIEILLVRKEEKIVPIWVSCNRALSEGLIVIPYEVKIAVGNETKISHGGYFNSKIDFILEYDDSLELVSVSW